MLKIVPKPFISFLVYASVMQHSNSFKHRIRLGPVEGLAGLKNDIVYKPPVHRTGTLDALVFFPGDIQNYLEEMTSERPDCLKYDLESVSENLSRKFPSKHILVVKPIRTEHGSFNYYDNFVVTGRFGGPDYMKNRRALPHLRRLLSNALKQAVSSSTGRVSMNLESCSAEEDLCHSASAASSDDNDAKINSITLVAFSKGCVVLNQIVTEIYLMADLDKEELEACNTFLKKIDEMAWLDGGHQGREGTWITNPNFVKKLFQTLPDLNVTMLVTPYQMNDSSRPWIGKECQRFKELCEAHSDRVKYKMFESSDRGSLETHFLALDGFGQTDL